MKFSLRRSITRSTFFVPFTIIFTFNPLNVFAQSQESEQSDSSANTTVVNVRGRQTLQQRFMAPNSMVVIDKQDIETMGANSIGDILRQTPGLQVTVTANGGLEIRMRGMSMESTRILIDGSPVSTSGRASQLPLDELPSDLIQRVEVSRAPTAEFQGTAGGTINIVMRSATPRPETYIWITDQIVWGKNAPRIFLSQTGPLSSPISAQTKSVDAQTAPVWSYFVSLTGGERLTGSDTDRKTSSSGAVTSSGSSHEKWRAQGTDWTLTPRLTGRLSDTDQVTLRAILSTTNRNGIGSSSGTGSNTTNATSNFSTEQPYIYKRDFSQLAVDWAHRFKTNRLETSLSFERGAELYQFNRTTDSSFSGKSSASYTDDRNDTGILLRSKLQGIAGENIWSIGTELENRKQNVLNISSINNLAAAPLSLQATVQRHALYAQNEWSLPKNTTLTTGLRAQQTKIESSVIGGTAVADDRIFLQPSLNSRTSIDENNQFRVNLARVSRSPRVWELIGRTVTESLNNSPSNPDFKGNPALKSETTVTFDIGWDHKLHNGGQSGINLFARKLQDAIARKTFQDNKGQWIQQPTNIGDATVWGIEADVRSNLVWAGFEKDWTLGANASLLNSKLDGGEAPGSRIPGQARYLANVNIAKPLRVAGGWYGGASVNLVGASDYDYSYQKTNGSTGSEKAHTNVDFYFGQVLPNLGFWRLNVYNITDFKRNRNRVTTDSAGTTTYIDNSIVRLTPRVFLTLGTRF
jgi:outer membrane receptor for ferrienterochelin and colicins